MEKTLFSKKPVKRGENISLTDSQEVKITTFYEEAKKNLLLFLNQEFEGLQIRFKTRFLDFFNEISTYEEEGTKIRPSIILTSDINYITKNIKDSYIVPLFNDKDELMFNSRMKALLPFCSKDWSVYVNITEAGIKYGIVKCLNSIKEPLLSESILTNDKFVNKKDFSLILIESFSSYMVHLKSVSGKQLTVNFSLTSKYASNWNTTVADFANASFSKLRTTARKLNDIKVLYKNILTHVFKDTHGTICVVVDKEYKDNGFFSDGIWLEEPISFSKLFLQTKSFHEPKLIAISDVFVEMLNSDGITIVDNTGKIRAYNVFIETNLKSTSGVIGGARKRAAYTIINSRRKHIVGVYFQSQDGEVFYAPVKKRT